MYNVLCLPQAHRNVDQVYMCIVASWCLYLHRSKMHLKPSDIHSIKHLRYMTLLNVCIINCFER